MINHSRTLAFDIPDSEGKQKIPVFDVSKPEKIHTASEKERTKHLRKTIACNYLYHQALSTPGPAYRMTVQDQNPPRKSTDIVKSNRIVTDSAYL